MRAGLNTIHQTLTPEAATVLNHSIAEANRRNHGQTTPLHVAATLLSSPSGYLRQACIRSHPNSSHPLQCRALELCFSVALERLPTAQNNSNVSTPNSDPPLSNALMAALKRAQAHQRRGCPEQQQPLLAVKVELEQLIVSILDDPSVSRVMREASFSSPAVKATIEQSLNSQSNSASSVAASVNGPKIGFGSGFRPVPQQSPVPSVSGRNLYLNPRLQQQHQPPQQRPGMMQAKPTMQSEQQRGDEVKKVIDILSRPRKRNPVLVGESEPETVLKDVLRKIERKEVVDEVLKNVEVISIGREIASARSQMLTKLKEMIVLIESRLISGSSRGRGIILDLGDLKWLVDQPSPSFGISGGGGEGGPNQGVSESGRAAVSEIGKLLVKMGEGSFGGKLWIVGTATCETYLRCQVYHPTMENEWDLQAVSMAARTPLPNLFPRLGSNGILSSSVESLSPLKSYTAASPALTRNVCENSDPSHQLPSCCPNCLEKCEQEVSKLSMEQAEKANPQVKSEGPLPQWLQNAKLHNNDLKGTTDPFQNEESMLKRRTQELQRKWTATCLRLHPSFHNHNGGFQRIQPTPTPVPVMGLYNPKLLACQPIQRRLQENRTVGDDLQLNLVNSVPSRPPASEQAATPPGSPVRTDLVLGRPKLATDSPLDKSRTTNDCTRNLLGCITNNSERQNKFLELQSDRPLGTADADSYKKLLKGLIDMVWWQKEAASLVAAAVTNCKLGAGKRRLGGTKGDTWLLFCGPDRAGKRKMAAALSEQISNVGPTVVSLGSRRDGQETELGFRGKTAIDRIAEAIRRNPHSVIMLQDIDEADTVIRGSIKRAMDRGRLADSHGREISLGNVIFILTATDSCDGLWNGGSVHLNEEKLASLASGGWQLKLIICPKTGKRPAANWPDQEDRASKQRKEAGSAPPFDLNQAADTEENDRGLDGSHNSSDLTVDNEEENNHEMRPPPMISSAPIEMIDSVDDVIVFKPVDYSLIRQNIETTIAAKYSLVMGDKVLPFKIEPDAVKKILAGVWLGTVGLEPWVEKVLVPSIHQLKAGLHVSENMTVRLELDDDKLPVDSGSRHGDWLPNRVTTVGFGER